MEPWNFSQEETEASSTLILLNCFTVFIRVYGKGLGKCDLAYNRAGCCPSYRLWPTFVIITRSERKSLYLLLNYTFIIQSLLC